MVLDCLAMTVCSTDVLWLPLQVMEFYCESCETAMCLDCTEGEHREHVTVPLRDVLEQHKAALKNQLDAIRNRYHTPSWSNQGLGSRRISNSGEKDIKYQIKADRDLWGINHMQIFKFILLHIIGCFLKSTHCQNYIYYTVLKNIHTPT